jgi:hypothetical protein
MCEDGRMRIYMDEMEKKGFWMYKNVKEVSKMNEMKKIRKKKVKKNGKKKGMVNLKIDFFEK